MIPHFREGGGAPPRTLYTTLNPRIGENETCPACRICRRCRLFMGPPTPHSQHIPALQVRAAVYPH